MVLLPVDGPGGQHPLGPELQRFHCDGNTFQLLLNIDEVLKFITGDFTVYRNFDQSLFLLALTTVSLITEK